MAERIAGIRFEPHGPLVFCDAGEQVLGRGQRVCVAGPEGTREGVVALAPDDIVAAPPLDAAPRVIAVIPGEVAGPQQGPIPPDVVFLPADDGPIGPADLARALALAALPLPEPPPERRR